MVDVLEGALEGVGCERLLTVEVWTSKGLLTHYVLFVISVAERAVHIAGITTRPDEALMLQVGRNLIDEESGALASKRCLIAPGRLSSVDRVFGYYAQQAETRTA